MKKIRKTQWNIFLWKSLRKFINKLKFQYIFLFLFFEIWRKHKRECTVFNVVRVLCIYWWRHVRLGSGIFDGKIGAFWELLSFFPDQAFTLYLLHIPKHFKKSHDRTSRVLSSTFNQNFLHSHHIKKKNRKNWQTKLELILIYSNYYNRWCLDIINYTPKEL
jgi:hypothetical protein